MKVILTDAEFAALPEPMKAEYEQKNGKYTLKIEGDVVPKSELDAANQHIAKFRDTNIDLVKDKAAVEAKLKQYDGVDPVEYVNLKKKVEEFGRSGANTPADIQAQIASAVKTAVEPLVSELGSLKTREAEAQQALVKRDLESKLTSAGLKAGVDEKAMQDYLNRGFATFQVKDGKVVAVRPDGTPLFSQKSPADPMGIEEWATVLPKEAPHLFKSSKGGGAAPAAGTRDGKPVVPADDPLAFGQNLEAIAKGQVVFTS